MSKATEIIRGYGLEPKQIRTYLHTIRRSGSINMFASGPLLSGAYGFTKGEADEIALTFTMEGLSEE